MPDALTFGREANLDDLGLDRFRLSDIDESYPERVADALGALGYLAQHADHRGGFALIAARTGDVGGYVLREGQPIRSRSAKRISNPPTSGECRASGSRRRTRNSWRSSPTFNAARASASTSRGGSAGCRRVTCSMR